MKVNSILLNFKHFILKKELKTTYSSNVPDLIFSLLEEIKEEASQALEVINDQIDICQARIDLSSSINIILDENTDNKIEYGQFVGSLFGMIYANTQLIDDIVINLNSIISGEYDEYPTIAISAMLMIWEEQSVLKLKEIVHSLDQLSSLRQTFEDISLFKPNVTKQVNTIH